MLKSYFTIGFVFILFAVCVIHFAPAIAADEVKTLNVYLPVNESMQDSSITKLLREFCITLGAETGYEVNMEIVPYRFVKDEAEMAYNALKEGKADITVFANSVGYVQMEDKVKTVATPEFTVSFSKSKHNKDCIYVRKGQEIEKISELEGTIWGGTNTVSTRMLLYENGIDKPVPEFFGDTAFLFDSPPSNLVDALANKKIDCFAADEHQLMMGTMSGKNSDGETVEIDSVDCTQGRHNWIFAMSKDLPEKVRARLLNRTINAHKDKAFKKFGFMFMAIKGNFEPFEESDLVRTREIADLMEKNGWDKESDEFQKKAPPPQTSEE